MRARREVVVWCLVFAFLLAVGTAGPAGAFGATAPVGRSAGSLIWVEVFEWSGGGSSNDIRNSAPFRLLGGQQYFGASTSAVTGPYAYPIAGWTVQSADGGGQFEMFNPPNMGQSMSYMYLPAGLYYVSSNTLDCWWNIGIYEARPAVSVTGFSPASGWVGIPVTIDGTGFIGATKVSFNGIDASASAVVYSATRMSVTVPAGATSGIIAVTAPGGVATSAASFTVTPAPLLPRITGFTPTSGLPGTAVTLTGTGFTGATAVSFNGFAATFSVVGPTQIAATVPPLAFTGTITVSTPGGMATSATSFTVVVTPTLRLALGGLRGGAIRLGRSVTAKGTVTPTSLAGTRVKLTAQQKRGAEWVKAKTAYATISQTGAYAWKYTPTRAGAYRMQATIAETATNVAATTTWLPLKVK